MTGLRYEELFVKAAHQGHIALLDGVRKYAEHFLVKFDLRNPVSDDKARLSGPTDMEGRSDVALAPIHDFLKLFPIVSLLQTASALLGRQL